MATLGHLIGAKRWVATELSALTVITIVSLYIQSSGPSSDLQLWLFFSPLGRGWWFALGMALAVLSVWAQKQQSVPSVISKITSWAPFLWAAGIVLYLFTSIVILEPHPSIAFPVIDQSDYLFSVIAFGLVALLFIAPAIFTTDDKKLISRVLSHRSLVWLGLVSYGIFLWHVPVLQGLLDLGIEDGSPGLRFLSALVATLVVTALVASVSFTLVERPLMRWSRKKR